MGLKSEPTRNRGLGYHSSPTDLLILGPYSGCLLRNPALTSEIGFRVALP